MKIETFAKVIELRRENLDVILDKYTTVLCSLFG